MIIGSILLSLSVIDYLASSRFKGLISFTLTLLLLLLTALKDERGRCSLCLSTVGSPTTKLQL